MPVKSYFVSGRCASGPENFSPDARDVDERKKKGYSRYEVCYELSCQLVWRGTGTGTAGLGGLCMVCCHGWPLFPGREEASTSV